MPEGEGREQTPFERYRRELGLRQVDVAHAASLPRSLINELERPSARTVRDIGARKLYRIASALGVRMETLLELAPLGSGNVTLPDTPALEALAEAAHLYDWRDEDVAMLAAVHYRNKRPTTPADWWFILQAIQRTVRQ